MNNYPSIQPQTDNTFPQTQPPLIDTPETSINNTPQSTNTNNNKIFILLGLIIVFLFITGGILAYRQYLSSQVISLDNSHMAPPLTKPSNINNTTKNQISKDQISELPNTPQPTPSIKTTLDLNISFQDFLIKNCQKTEPNTGFYTISLSNIPLTINQQILSPGWEKSEFGPPYVYCLSLEPLSEKKGLIVAGGSQNFLRYTIHDQNSDSPGGGGYPELGELGTPFKITNDTQLTFYLERPHGGPMLTDSTPLMIRGRKTFVTSNGEEIYINVSSQAIEANDPRLVSVLNQHSQPVDIEGYGDGAEEYYKDKLAVDLQDNSLNLDLLKTLFEPINPNSPEGIIADKIQNNLDSIQPNL